MSTVYEVEYMTRTPQRDVSIWRRRYAGVEAAKAFARRTNGVVHEIVFNDAERRLPIGELLTLATQGKRREIASFGDDKRAQIMVNPRKVTVW